MKRTSHDRLNERIKELNCSYGVSEICRAEDTVERILSGVVELIPQAFLVPEKTHCELAYRGHSYQSPSFQPGRTVLRYPDVPNRSHTLVISVHVESAEQEFLPEERNLIEHLWRIVSESLDKRETEARARSDQDKLTGFYEAGLVGLAVTSLEKGWVMVNDRLCDLFGYPREQLVTMTWSELTHPDDLEADLAAFQKLLDGTSDYYEMDKRFFHRQGSIIYAKIAVRVVRHPDRRPDYFLAMVEDVTSRSLAELNLLRKHEEMLAIFESSEALIYVVDPVNETLVFSNRKDLQGSTEGKCFERIYGKSEPCAFCRNAQLISGSGPIKWEYVDSSNRTHQMLDQTVQWPDGRTLRLTFANDISELAKARFTILDQENRYRSIVQSAPVSIWDEDWSEVYRYLRPLCDKGAISDYRSYFETHPEWVVEALKRVRVVDVNCETVRMFEAEDKEQMLASLETVFSTEDTLPGFVGELVALCEGHGIYRNEMRLRTVKNNAIEVMLTMTFPPIESEGSRVIVSLMDISERVSNERKLRDLTLELERSNYRMGAIMDSMDALIYVADMDSYEILYLNAYGRRIFGDVIGKTCWKTFQSGLNGPCSFCTNSLLMQDGKSAGVHRWEFQNTVNRHWYDCRDQAIPWTDGRYVRMEIAFDITERIHTAERLSVTLAQLKRSNEELEQFAYVASHDLQEPLRMITSFTQLFARKYEGLLDDKAQSYIGFIVDGGSRMHRLLNDLLDFSRVDRKGEAFGQCDLNLALGKALMNLKLSIEEKQAQVTSVHLPTLLADSTQMMRLFQNLISNSLKFRSHEAPEVFIDCEEEPGRWKFSVRDNGIGIDPRYKDRIFELFQRLHLRDKYEGTGIGLAICKKVVMRHGGEIWVESAEGAGSTFYFTLPKRNEA